MVPVSESLRFLIGVGGRAGTNMYDDPSTTTKHTNLVGGLTLPAALEIRALPQVGIRLEGALASLSFQYDKYDLGYGTNSNYIWTAQVGYGQLGLGFYYYF